MDNEEKPNDNSRFISDVLYADVTTKEKQLTVNSNKTVQPVAMMRLGVFVPKPARKKALAAEIDATELLSNLEFVNNEGYTNIKITGPRLDMETDFKAWIGVIQSFSKYGLTSNKITLPFKEFASFCGYTPKRLDASLRTKLQDSITRLRAKTIAFSTKDNMKRYSTGLVKTALVDIGEDVVVLEADESIWEIYEFDYRVLLQLKAIKNLAKKELAQSLYTFFESLPANPFPVSFNRLRERISLTSEVKGQNRAIKKGLEQLKEIGYLEYTLTTKDRENFVIIHSRRPSLMPPKGE